MGPVINLVGLPDATSHGKGLHRGTIALWLIFMSLPQAIIFSLIIVRAAQGRKYPKVQTSILGSLQFVRRSQVTTVRRPDTTISHDEHGIVQVDLESGELHYQQDGSGSNIIEKTNVVKAEV